MRYEALRMAIESLAGAGSPKKPGTLPSDEEIIDRAKAFDKFLSKEQKQSQDIMKNTYTEEANHQLHLDVHQKLVAEEKIIKRAKASFDSGVRHAFDRVVLLVDKFGLTPDSEVSVSQAVTEIKNLRDELLGEDRGTSLD